MRYILIPFAVFYVYHLKRKLRKLVNNKKYKSSSRWIAEQKLILAKLEYMETQLSPWGYFHPSPSTTQKRQHWLQELFHLPFIYKMEIFVLESHKDFGTVSRNMIYELRNGDSLSTKEYVDYIRSEWEHHPDYSEIPKKYEE